MSEGEGIYLADSGANDNQIGGTAPGAGNVVSGCHTGIGANGRQRNRIQGNIVGADASGTIALGNLYGMILWDGRENLVEGNIVVASRYTGIVLDGESATSVVGNFVGTDRTGTRNLGNGFGIRLWGGCTGTKVGGTEDGAANTIAFSLGDGVAVIDLPSYPPPQANSIRGNSIRQNGDLGINLMPWGEPSPWGWGVSVVTLNDIGDADIGPNNLQNYPVIVSAIASSASATITGTLNSTPNTGYILDFYANSACDPSGYGEGERYLGAASVTTDNNGDTSFSVVLPVVVPVGWTLTATATDPAGNTSEFSACSAPTVDATPPEITTPGNIAAGATGPAGAVVSFGVSAQDAVSGPVPVTCAPPSGSVFPLGTTTVTATAADEAGNIATATFTVTVQDTTAPVLVGVPADITVECNAVPPVPVVTATDTCDPSPPVTFNEVRVNGNCPNDYALQRTWTATDARGNSSSQTQTITVKDTTAPVLAGVPANLTVECNAVPAPAVVTAADNCDPSPRVTFNEVRVDGNCANNYMLRRTWTATDACGNSSTQTQTITVHDTTAPVLVGVPANMTVECNAVPAPVVVTATHNCDLPPQVTFNEVRENGNCANNYVLRRTWAATDACGNVSSQTQVLTVRDTTPPTISAVTASPTVLWPANHKLVLVTINYTATDACGPVTYALSATSNEPDNGLGDGDTANDIQLIPGDAHRLWLRAERSGTGNGRIYTITITATDACRNTPVSKNVTVAVPKSLTGSSYSQ